MESFWIGIILNLNTSSYFAQWPILMLQCFLNSSSVGIEESALVMQLLRDNITLWTATWKSCQTRRMTLPIFLGPTGLLVCWLLHVLISCRPCHGFLIYSHYSLKSFLEVWTDSTLKRHPQRQIVQDIGSKLMAERVSLWVLCSHIVHLTGNLTKLSFLQKTDV